MTACLSENIPHQLRSTIDHKVLVRKVWIGVHIAGDAQNALDPLQRSKAFAHSPQHVGCAQGRGLSCCLEANLRREPCPC